MIVNFNEAISDIIKLWVYKKYKKVTTMKKWFRKYIFIVTKFRNCNSSDLPPIRKVTAYIYIYRQRDKCKMVDV